MSLPQETLLELMAYADGELSDDALARVESLLASNEEAQQVVAAMGVLGDWVRVDLAVHEHVASADGIADQVMRRLEREGRVAPVVPITRRAAVATGRRVQRAAAGGLVGLLALAAGTALVMRSHGTPLPGGTSAGAVPPTISEVASSGKTGPADLAKPAQAEVAANEHPAEETPAGAGVDVEQVEANTHAFSVFYLPAVAAEVNANVSSVVVWIGDDKKGH